MAASAANAEPDRTIDESTKAVAPIKLDLFGRVVIATQNEFGWKIFYAGSEGKRRPALDIVVPPEIPESQLEQYLADLCHEWATEQNPGVNRLS